MFRRVRFVVGLVALLAIGVWAWLDQNPEWNPREMVDRVIEVVSESSLVSPASTRAPALAPPTPNQGPATVLAMLNQGQVPTVHRLPRPFWVSTRQLCLSRLTPRRPPRLPLKVSHCLARRSPRPFSPSMRRQCLSQVPLRRLTHPPLPHRPSHRFLPGLVRQYSG